MEDSLETINIVTIKVLASFTEKREKLANIIAKIFITMEFIDQLMIITMAS